MKSQRLILLILACPAVLLGLPAHAAVADLVELPLEDLLNVEVTQLPAQLLKLAQRIKDH